MKSEIRIGYALCGSFCNFENSISVLEKLKTEYEHIIPVMSETAYGTDTRFGRAADYIARISEICSSDIIHTITDAEPVGPNHMFDILVVSPCTGNTLSKLASGITDTAVTMAVKSHLRNGRPVLIALATNDGLSGSANSISLLLRRKNYYFVPFRQDDPINKPNSIIADFGMIPEAIVKAFNEEQLQPLLLH